MEQVQCIQVQIVKTKRTPKIVETFPWRKHSHGSFSFWGLNWTVKILTWRNDARMSFLERNKQKRITTPPAKTMKKQNGGISKQNDSIHFTSRLCSRLCSYGETYCSNFTSNLISLQLIHFIIVFRAYEHECCFSSIEQSPLWNFKPPDVQKFTVRFSVTHIQ